jgi:cleavage and polyadenylation specificity factor subunit 3
MQLQKEQLLTGVLVQNDFKLSLMAPDDLREYAGLTTTVVTCRQKVPMSVAGVALVRWSLEGMFGGVVNLEDDDEEEEEENGSEKDIPQEEDDADMYGGEKSKMSGRSFRVMDCVTVRCMKGYVELEWVGNVLNDGIADAVLAVLMTLESSPAAVKCEPIPPHRMLTLKHQLTQPYRLRLQIDPPPPP